MRENSFFIVKLAYGKESLQCRCPMATIRTVGDLHRLIEEAWPSLRTVEYTATLRGGRELSTWPRDSPISALISEGLAESVYMFPRLKLRVKASQKGSSGSKKGPQPMDGHKPASMHLQSCRECEMFPIVGRSFNCATCPPGVLCAWCYDKHDKHHTITPLVMACDGVWEGSMFTQNARDMTEILRERHRPWPGDTVDIDYVQVGENPLPAMVAEVFSKSEAHHEAITSGCFDDGKTILFECDGRGDINLCDMCYILWGGDVMKIAYKCSRVLLPGAWNPVGQGPCRLVHYGVTCAECGVSPIRGRRYHCDFCTEYDLCEGCYKEEANRKHRETHLFTLVVKPVKVWTVQMREPKGTLMSTIPCERCGQLPVGGATYSTVALPDSHYCLPCYREGLRFEALCVIIEMANDYVLKVSYGGESLRVKLRVDKFTTMGQLRKLIVTAWPFLEEGVWKVILPNGGVLGQKGIKTPVVAYLSEDHKDPSGHVPELRLKIESSESPSVSAPSVGQQEGVQAVDGHPLAVNYWETCDVCGMFPIVGQWYICFTCRQKDLCFACRNGHAGGHKVISYAPSVDGIWENYGLFESLHRQAFKLRALGVPTVQPKFE
ncbi:hypothetical protein Pmar_PMAR027951 [Perkinsus marinus ATCC 50983]|uniref:ZZ-type domain-containing protein n=1 Tax=Perkinsus marinus (strain ATCC 50983 / TXsc) TaxID=423536 RepID=C5LDH6_PERM5|nr:hypothetical protein Pmar_PMAR027951 [Perkinsus marinus ATCC 50983]EER05308.1 hypothetical protein Pmar_PMAR027951 [Perkinsus marinus ATCC 50983]|eukprot:XP_002773492.1 hypothetical protein Pmar_PMAR027951 [Perkinsus marinus ATCC 50983]